MKKIRYDRQNRIHFEPDVRFELSRNARSSNYLFRLILIFAGTSSSIGMLASFFDFGIDIVSVITYCAVFVLLTAMAHYSSSKLIKGFIIVIFVAHLLMILLLLPEIRDGVMILIYRYFLRVKIDVSGIEPIVREITHTPEFLTTCASIFASLIVMLVLFASLLFTTNFIVAFLITFPFFELGMYWGLVPSYLALFTMIVFWICVMSMQLLTFSVRKGSVDSAFSPDSNFRVFYFTSKKLKREFNAQVGTYVALTSCFVIMIVMAGTWALDYERPTRLSSVRSRVSFAIENFSVDNLIEGIRDFSLEDFEDIVGTKTVGGTSGGRLGKSAEISFSQRKVLEVFTPSQPSGTLYLKGYCGGAYDGESWSQLDSSAYESDDIKRLFESLEADGRSIQSIPAEILAQEYSAVARTVTIKNVSASKRFLYAPYGTVFNAVDAENVIGDTYFSSNRNEYTLDYYDYTNSSANDVFSTIFTDSEAEDAYRNFVLENYCDFSEEMYPDIAQHFGFNFELYGYDDELIKSVQEYVWSRTEYSLKPGETPDDKDFINYFLYENGKGYCTHYASAGVMIFRSLGIPARYAEGYIVPASSFGKLTYSDGYYASVLDSSAHAWVEIYILGFGWYPIEMTPGGYSEGENPNLPTSATENTVTTTTTTATTTQRPAISSVVSTSTTSSGAVSSAVGSGGTLTVTMTEEVEESFSFKALPIWAIILIFFVACMILLCIMIVMRRKIVIKRLNKRINGADNAIAVTAMYKHFLKLLPLWQINCSSFSTDAEVVEVVERQAGEIAERFKLLNDLAVMSHFSTHEISDNEREQAKLAYDGMMAVAVEKLSAFGRFSAKYFLNLI